VKDFPIDRYGRTIGDVLLSEDVILNQEMVGAGLHTVACLRKTPTERTWYGLRPLLCLARSILRHTGLIMVTPRTTRTRGTFVIPTCLPVDQYDIVNERVAQRSVDKPDLWYAFAAAWNGLAYRTKAALEHASTLSASVSTSRPLRMTNDTARIMTFSVLLCPQCRQSSAFTSLPTALAH
jgi:hypothetical protein